MQAVLQLSNLIKIIIIKKYNPDMQEKGYRLKNKSLILFYITFIGLLACHKPISETNHKCSTVQDASALCANPAVKKG